MQHLPCYTTEKNTDGREVVSEPLIAPLRLTHPFNEHILNRHIQVLMRETLQPVTAVFSHDKSGICVSWQAEELVLT